ncbi:NUDIX domain-containing protein [Henriciella aquimarina]|uniref:NUDIX domain-containing protein n=1 Tax=Henriciella aquimarina TaxID=545261 RepID=UPI00117B9279|nr:NUDIX domain-containing protein [Henriciella aquimarina]
MKNIERTVLSDDWAVLSKYEFDYRHSDGRWEHQDREVYDRGESVAVLPYDPGRGTVLLLRQFRLPVALTEEAAAGEEGLLIEACAGAVDDDSTEETVHREALEELGVRLHEARAAFTAYSSPGSLSERVACYTARYAPSDRVEAGGGRSDEGEDIEVLEMPLEEAFAMIASGAIRDAKTIALLQHLKLSLA